MSIEESIEAPNAPNSRSRGPIFEALAEAQGIDLQRLTASARSKLNKAASEIRTAEPGATAEQVRIAVHAWTRKYPNTPVTAMTLASHWPELAPALPTVEDEAARKACQKKIHDARQRLDTLSDHSGTIPFPRDDLTEVQLEEYRRLKEMVEGQRHF